MSESTAKLLWFCIFVFYHVCQRYFVRVGLQLLCSYMLWLDKLYTVLYNLWSNVIYYTRFEYYLISLSTNARIKIILWLSHFTKISLTTNYRMEFALQIFSFSFSLSVGFCVVPSRGRLNDQTKNFLSLISMCQFYLQKIRAIWMIPRKHKHFCLAVYQNISLTTS